MPVKPVQSMGWTRRSAAVSVLLAMESHRKEAGARVVHLREQQRLNQEDLAHRAGVSVKTISRFENGRHDGRRATIQAIAKALGVNEADIIGAPPDPLGLSVDKAQDEFAERMDRIEEKLDRLLAILDREEARAQLDDIIESYEQTAADAARAARPRGARAGDGPATKAPAKKRARG